MARIGSFIGPTDIYSSPINAIKPADNNVTKSRFHELLRDPALKLTEDEMISLQDQINELLGILKIARDLP